MQKALIRLPPQGAKKADKEYTYYNPGFNASSSAPHINDYTPEPTPDDDMHPQPSHRRKTQPDQAHRNNVQQTLSPVVDEPAQNAQPVQNHAYQSAVTDGVELTSTEPPGGDSGPAFNANIVIQDAGAASERYSVTIGGLKGNLPTGAPPAYSTLPKAQPVNNLQNQNNTLPYANSNHQVLLPSSAPAGYTNSFQVKSPPMTTTPMNRPGSEFMQPDTPMHRPSSEFMQPDTRWYPSYSHGPTSVSVKVTSTKVSVWDNQL